MTINTRTLYKYYLRKFVNYGDLVLFIILHSAVVTIINTQYVVRKTLHMQGFPIQTLGDVSIGVQITCTANVHGIAWLPCTNTWENFRGPYL